MLEKFKKTHGITRAGYGEWNKLIAQLGLPSNGWENLSTGQMLGYFDSLKLNNGLRAYAYLADADSEHWLIWIVKGQRSLSELREAMPLFLELAFQKEKFQMEKTCFECGRKFTLEDVTWNSSLPVWKAFRKAVEDYKNDFCGCDH